MTEGNRVLIADDDPLVHESLSLYLRAEGYEPVSVYDGNAALQELQIGNIALGVLDIMMPGRSGLEVCRLARETVRTPLLLLTARGEEPDRILGLELGADDYIVKPFSPREVVARIKAVLRRVAEASAGGVEDSRQVLRFSGLEIRLDQYTVRVKGEPVTCTPKEVEILHMLASKPGQVFSRDQILTQVWGYDFVGDTRTVDTHIKRVRAKIAYEGAPWALRTVYGVGYKFEVLG